MISLRLSLITSFTVLALAACSTNSPTVDGSHLSVAPVSYQYSISVKKDGIMRAREEIDAYLLLNRKALLVYGAKISWKGKQGQKLAQKSYLWLIRQGLSPEKVSLQTSSGLEMDSITISSLIYQVQAPSCDYVIISGDNRGNDGCTVETMRWESMVYPERKISGQSQISGVLPQNPM
ncbi:MULTISPECIES: hypothetical protein [Grimontia]|uniref:Uncharacterized protein n=1 Tax=Grimontia marina TaxID=646534 RepID=A0A128F377_9GAMM|nr:MULTISPECIES: hypothetical protein [Grimontia]WRW00541.1 hypothetical protein VP504_18975 [Grimontia sp. NTOU-MAR1]CZF80696.1 hypothetical protein GMA8713_01557 [Grimontia marina]